MEYKIQSLVFPTDEKHQQCRKLFYRGDHAILDCDEHKLTMGFAQHCDFVTYINACSYQKWLKYTNAGTLTLHLEFEGEAELTFIGYTKKALTVNQTVFDKKKFTNKKRSTIEYRFPANEEQMVGFEITALSNCVIYGGYYTVEVDKNNLNDITLSIATTTCNKKEFILKNTKLIKDSILDGDDDVAKNTFLHVVDNGRTLNEKDFRGKHIFLHPNINAGGSGGFARGMMESLHQKVRPTHVLLMDDDVLVLPESIKRTYALLKLRKDEFRDYFINGAMLYYENPKCQHEDVGTIDEQNNSINFAPLKERLNHETILSNLENERFYPKHRNAYGAWWYCCIPTTTIEKSGLPLPIFIRIDDAEYSLRSDAQHITMNGISIWHMGFTTKYNAAFDRYQNYRNLLIANACFDELCDIDLTKAIYSGFRVEILKFNYSEAKLIIKALEDFLKGPKFLEQPIGDKIAKENFKLNNTMVPLHELEGGDSFRVSDSFLNPAQKFSEKLIMRLTWNGQRWWSPKWLERDGVVPILMGQEYQGGKMYMRNRMIIVNPFDRTGAQVTKDKKQFKRLMRRFNKSFRYLRKHHSSIKQQYRAKSAYLTSEEFWNKYLGLKNA